MKTGKAHISITPHPFYIAKLMYPYLTLMIIPVLKGAVDYIFKRQHDLPDFFTAELILLAVITAVSYIKLQRMKIIISDSISVSKGLFCRITYEIPRSAASLAVVESNPVLKLFGIYRLKIYTEAGKKSKPDEDIPIRKRDAAELCELYKVAQKPVERGTPLNNIFMAAASSSISTGLFIAAPIVKVAASLLGKSVSSLLPEIADAAGFPENIPDIGWYLSMIVFVGYAVSFSVIVLRHSGFKSVSDSKRITLDAGAFPHRTIFFERKAVTAVSFVSSPLMRLAGRCLVKFSSCGYGKSSGELGVLIPCIKKKNAGVGTAEFLPEFFGVDGGIKPRLRAIGRCFSIPVVLSLVISFCGSLSAATFAAFGSIIWLVTVILLLIDILYISVRIDALLNGSFQIKNKKLSIRTRKGFSAVELTVNIENVESVSIIRTPFDRISHLCRVRLRVFNKSNDSVSLPYLPYKQIIDLIKRPE